MNLLIIDIETSGLNIEKDYPIECAAILFNVDIREILQSCSTLIYSPSNNAYNINKISISALSSQYNPDPGFTMINNMISQCDFIVSHNKEFDSLWFKKIGLNDLGKTWLCTAVDFKWPSIRSIPQRPQLISLALAYEIPVWKVHRAINDCLYIAWIFEKEENLLKILEDAQKIRNLYVADITFEEKNIAKEAGFVWNRFVQNKWSCYLTEQEVKELPFKVSKVLIP